MDRSKAIDRIQKAMNLASNASATPGEAAAALNLAQKMMEKYGIEEADLGIIGYGSEKVHCPVQAAKTVPSHLSLLVGLVRKAFGVQPVFTSERRVSDLSWVVEYFGPEHRVAMACYTHQVLHRAIERSWAEEIKRRPSVKGVRGARVGFYIGWIQAVRAQVMEMAFTEEEKAKTDALMTREYPALKKLEPKRASGLSSTAAAGREAADGFRLHRPMGSAAPQKQLGA